MARFRLDYKHLLSTGSSERIALYICDNGSEVVNAYVIINLIIFIIIIGAPSSSLDLTALRRTSVVPHNRDGCNYSSSVPNGRPRSFSCSTAVVSRYEQDFEELEKLGKGGYGRVYRVRNRLDGSEYPFYLYHV